MLEEWIFFGKIRQLILSNYCGINQLKIIDFASDSVLELPWFNPEFKKIYVKLGQQDIFVTDQTGKVEQFCNSNLNRETFLDLMSDSLFKNSGLMVADYKAGGDQYVDVRENVFYLRLKQDYESTSAKYSKMNSGYPSFGKLNLGTKKIEFFGKEPLFEPDQTYGLISNLHYLYKGDSIITCHGHDGQINIINTIDGSVKQYNAKSKYDIYPVKKWKYHKWMKDAKNKKMQHWIQSPSYESLFYNPYTKKYYRVFHPKLDPLNKDGLSNTGEDKECVLMVFDEKFKLVDEVLLPVKRLNLVKLFPIKDGVAIYLPYLFKVEPNKMTYSYLNIHHN